MRLNVSEIPDEGLKQELEYTIKLDTGENAQVSFSISRYGRKVLIEGTIIVTLILECSRCLKEKSYPMHLTFRDECNPAEETEKDPNLELTGKDMDLDFYINDEIDINDIVSEQVLLSVPMNPLCGTQCKGICSECGKDLNDGACECIREETDQRLAPLVKLREAMKNRKE